MTLEDSDYQFVWTTGWEEYSSKRETLDAAIAYRIQPCINHKKEYTNQPQGACVGSTHQPQGNFRSARPEYLDLFPATLTSVYQDFVKFYEAESTVACRSHSSNSQPSPLVHRRLAGMTDARKGYFCNNHIESREKRSFGSHIIHANQKLCRMF